MGAPRYLSDMSRPDFEASAAGFILSGLDAALQSGGRASLFLSGGQTPEPIYERLSETNFPWEKINIGLVDERWVPETDKGSNAALIQRTLLQNRAKGTGFTPMKTCHKTAKLGHAKVEERYGKLFKVPTIAVLGMGTDGHICSWFPDAEGLEDALDSKNTNYLQPITAKPSDVTGLYLDRMSLTLTALHTCDKILLLIIGDEKKAVLESAINSGNDYLPVAHLLAMANTKPNNPLTILHAA